MAAQSELDELTELRERVKALEQKCAEYESNAIVEPYIAANAKMEKQCVELKERCNTLERENSTLALSLAYFHTQMNDEVETINSEGTPAKSKQDPLEGYTPERVSRADSDMVRFSDDNFNPEPR